jgi:creatine kinase
MVSFGLQGAVKKLGRNAEFDFGGKAMGDPKDTSDFDYLTYSTLPKWTPKHKSLMAKCLTQSVFDQLKDKKTSKGYTLSNAIQTGVETPHLGVGLTCGDEESFEVFKDLIYPVIKGWHKGYDAATMTHPTDLNAENLTFSAEQEKLFDEYVVSTRIRAARNISGFGLPAGTNAADRAGVEDVLKKTFAGFTGDLKGTYYPLGGLSKADEDMLLSSGFLFQKPTGRNLLTAAGAARDWPNNRGIFHNEGKTALCWCNEEDHCRIISTEAGGNVKAVFARFAAISDNMKQSAEAAGAKLMHTDNLGFLGSCPSNLGTGMRASVELRWSSFPKFNRNLGLLERVCDQFDLQGGEVIGGKFDVSNKQRIGFSEVQLVQKVIDGVTKLIFAEQLLFLQVPQGEIPALLAGTASLQSALGARFPALQACAQAAGGADQAVAKTQEWNEAVASFEAKEVAAKAQATAATLAGADAKQAESMARDQLIEEIKTAASSYRDQKQGLLLGAEIAEAEKKTHEDKLIVRLRSARHCLYSPTF